MYEQTDLAPLIRIWVAEGKWIDRGSRVRTKRGALQYRPTPQEIEAKCELLRSIDSWRGARQRAPRGGKYAVMTFAKS